MYLIAENKCPYCHKGLSKTPKKKALCNNCGKSFRVVTRPSDRQKVIATEAENVAFKFYTNLVRFFPTEKVFEDTFENTKKELQISFKHEPQEADILWSISNRLIQDKAKIGDLAELGQLYFEMALYLHQIGKPCFLLKQQSSKMELMSYKGIYDKVQITANICCNICKKLDGKIFPFNEALKKLPIPVKNCVNKLNEKAPDGWCICGYLPSS